MAKVYSAPIEIKLPNISDFSWNDDGYKKACKAYVEELRKSLKQRKPKGKLVGEIARFPVADGYAEYMVASLRPLELVHIDTWDGWHFQYVERLTAKDISKNVEGQRFLASR